MTKNVNEGDTALKIGVMSFNLRNMHANDGGNRWELRRNSVAAVIRTHRPDFVGTQEGFMPQIDQLRELLPEYTAVATGRDDGNLEGETCAIFYVKDRWTLIEHGTFWFSDTPETPGSRQWTPYHARICTWVRLLRRENGCQVALFNVHLDHETQTARERSVQLLLQRMAEIAKDATAVAMGDFNMTPDNPALRAMSASVSFPLVDTFSRVDAHDEAVAGTFHDFTGRRDMGRIDYIFCNENCVVTRAEVLHDRPGDRYPSDHFPVLARIEV